MEVRYNRSKIEWSKKEAALRSEHERQKSVWEKEFERYLRDKQNWEIERREAEEERQRQEKLRRWLGIGWDTPFGHACTSYGTRPYNARLVNVPSYMDPVQVCAEMPIQFHGRTIDKPVWCERLQVC